MTKMKTKRSIKPYHRFITTINFFIYFVKLCPTSHKIFVKLNHLFKDNYLTYLEFNPHNQ